MEFPLHKEWMGEKQKLGNIHTSGVLDFMEFAKKNKRSLDKKILCPCSVCKNRHHQTPEEVEYHLLRSGMQLEYTFWKFHGETKENPYVPVPEVEVNRDQVQERQRTQDQVNQHNIRKDALARLKGPDKKGRIRGVSSSMSKMKYLGIQTVKKFMKRKTVELDNVADSIRRENDERFNEIISRLDRIEGRSSSDSCSTPTSQSSPTIPINTTSAAIPGSSSMNVPSSPSTCIYRICSTVSYDCIAVGSAAISQLVGENVHGIRLNDHETKVNVTVVTPGRENDPLYKGTQAGAFTIGEMVGNYIIWPTILLRAM